MNFIGNSANRYSETDDATSDGVAVCLNNAPAQQMTSCNAAIAIVSLA